MKAQAQHTLPAVSVVMPLRNAMPYLDQAIASIMGQTLADFELVIGDDASSDGSSDCAASWAARDPRIRLFRRDVPGGPAGSGNWVSGLARAPVIARMDADDLSEPDRLERQLAALEADPGSVLVGSTYRAIDAANRVIRQPDLAALVQGDPLTVPFAHGSIMFRRSAFEQVGGYRAACDYWEDGDLFRRLAAVGRITVLVDPLYSYRCAGTSNRLRADTSEVERQLALQLVCRSRFRQTGSYEEELADPDKRWFEPPMQVFQQRASIQVWAGQRSPALLVWWRSRPRKFRWQDAPMLAYLLWAFASPRSIRWLLAKRVKLANNSVKAKLHGREVVFWPGSGPGKRPDASKTEAPHSGRLR